jgi:hypothetical protein
MTGSTSIGYAAEEVSSNYGYLSGYYKPNNVKEQVASLRKLFPGLDGCDFALGEKEPPVGAEGFFAIPRWQLIAPIYNEALQKALDSLKSQLKGRLSSYLKSRLGPDRLRQSDKAAAFWGTIGEEQKGFDTLLIPAQFGIRHRGRSVRCAREVMDSNECGLGRIRGRLAPRAAPAPRRSLDRLCG